MSHPFGKSAVVERMAAAMLDIRAAVRAVRRAA